MKKKFIFVLVMLLPLLAVNAQETKALQQKLNGGFGNFSLSVRQIGLNPLNDYLSQNGYGKISTVNMSYGGGGYFCVNNLLIGGGGEWIRSTSFSSPDNSGQITGGSGHFDIGYVLCKNKRSFLYSTVGAGGGGYSITIYSKSVKPDFNQQLNNPTGMVQLNAGGWLCNMQLGYNFFLRKAATDGFFIGVKGGYSLSSDNNRFYQDNKVVNNSPSVNLSGFYLSLTLGGGGLFTKNLNN